jgi:hypothetical protein
MHKPDLLESAAMQESATATKQSIPSTIQTSSQVAKDHRDNYRGEWPQTVSLLYCFNDRYGLTTSARYLPDQKLRICRQASRRGSHGIRQIPWHAIAKWSRDPMHGAGQICLYKFDVPSSSSSFLIHGLTLRHRGRFSPHRPVWAILHISIFEFSS